MTDRTPMTEERERHLIEQVRTLTTLDEAYAFRACITETETMGSSLYRVLTTRIDVLAKREGKA